MRLLLARHGTTGSKYKGRYIGSTDLPLAHPGSNEVQRLAEIVVQYQPDRYLCSPMLRAKQTMEKIVASKTVQVETDDDLREIDFGRWEGLSFAEICRSDQEKVNQWQKEACAFCFPEGEDNGAFIKRVHFVADRLASLDQQTILVVSHGGVIRFMICYFLGLDPENYLLFNAKPAHLTVLDIEQGKGILTGFNL